MTWQAASLAILTLVLAGGFAWYERRKPPARVVALVAAMAALAVVGRLAFAALPNVKPTTDIVLFAGYALGPVPGFAVGAITAIASNVFLGQGPWTAWQMVAWGGVGIGGALLARAYRGREPGRVELAIACGVAGLAFGAFMDVYQWTLAARQDLPSYLAIAGSSLPYNLAHAAGNVVFCLLIGPVFIRSLRRYRRRFEVRWAPALGPATVVALALGLMLALAPVASAASPASRAATYLKRIQNRDGGFGAGKGQRSSQLMTGWIALGLESARLNPREVKRRKGRAVTTYLRRGAGGLRDTGELERTIMVLASAGLKPRAFAGRDLVSELLRRRRPDGSWAANVAHTAFGIFALRGAGQSTQSDPIRNAARWLADQQNADGGFGYVAKAQSDTDDTGAVLQALGAAGLGRGPVAQKGVAYLRKTQNGDGGWGQMQGRSSNAQSTSWVIQGLTAAGVSPYSMGSGPIRYLLRLQRRDGHIRYSRSSDQTPAWVTAQALTALKRKPFPLAVVPLKKKARSSVAAALPSDGGGAASAGSEATEEKPDAGAAAAAAGAAAAAPGGGTGPSVPSKQRIKANPTSVAGAVAEPDDDGGPSTLLIALAAGLALIAVGGTRWWLRRRHAGTP
jgi:energy-coupling factor transport system substrate-specific component